MKCRRRPLLRCSSSRLLEMLEPRCLLSAAVVTQISAQSFTIGHAAASLALSPYFDDSAIPAGDTVVDIETDLPSPYNNIPLYLTNAATPNTVANFLQYINSGAYANTIIQRSVPGFILQGGGYTSSLTAIAAGSAIAGESSTATLKNTTGTIAMALSTGPDSGTNQWFFNLADNTNLDDTSDGGPFTAFGSVFDNGLATINDIATLPIVDDTSTQPTGDSNINDNPLGTLPVISGTNGANVTTEAASNLVTLNPVVISGDGLTYSASSSNLNIVTTSVSNGTLSFTPRGVGTATITVTATDLGGGTTTETFTVDVAGVPPVSSAVPTFAKSTLPATVIAGQPLAKAGTLTVNVTNDTGNTVKGSVTVDLYASANGTLGSSSVFLDAGKKTLTLKAGQTSPITVSVPSIPASLGAGSYTLVAQSIDSLNTLSSAVAGPTLTVVAPVVSLSPTITKLPVSATAAVNTKTGAAATLHISNTGNINAVGLTTISLFLSPDGLSDDETLITTYSNKKLTVVPGKPVTISIPLKAFPNVAAGTYSVIAQLTAPDGTVTTSAFASTITLEATVVKTKKSVSESSLFL